MTDSFAKKRIQTAIRMMRPEVCRVLLEVWDPIGIGDESSAKDEYDCCVDQIIRHLFKGATDDEIAEYLRGQASEHYGCAYRKENALPTVAALRRIKLPTTLGF
jgi:hypothetical protein